MFLSLRSEMMSVRLQDRIDFKVLIKGESWVIEIYDLGQTCINIFSMNKLLCIIKIVTEFHEKYVFDNYRVQNCKQKKYIFIYLVTGRFARSGKSTSTVIKFSGESVVSSPRLEYMA